MYCGEGRPIERSHQSSILKCITTSFSDGHVILAFTELGIRHLPRGSIGAAHSHPPQRQRNVQPKCLCGSFQSFDPSGFFGNRCRHRNGVTVMQVMFRERGGGRVAKSGLQVHVT